MRIISGQIIIAITLLMPLILNANQYKIGGVDISNPNDTTGYQFNNSLDAIGAEFYIRNDAGLFDRAILNKGLGYILIVNFPNAARYIEIYDDIVKSFGYENENKDKIPSGYYSDDIISMAMLISEGKAEIIRFWYEEKFNIKLSYTQKDLKVYVSYF